ncbi:hypothetical protein P154DRAFT_593442 [Amniculicola lignicola CBS 123094]|uniref:Uncharacterized protein n=1 Tax=Amniculicola lignicola CBS 123094 TaxID=1392246 RepID=A0A6A5WQ90_9PLEO|nr:hypothetical protein P154DRAFT_593442 [Amniculicola lignicola CBS 123094]
MPTPNAMLSPPAEHESHLAGHTTCPPEDARSRDSSTTRFGASSPLRIPSSSRIIAQQPTPPPTEQDLAVDAHSPTEPQSKTPDADAYGSIIRNIPTPVSATDDGPEEQRHPQTSPLSTTAPTPVAWLQSGASPSPFPGYRFLPNSSSSLLRPGSKFKGSQTSDRQQYEVEVEIKHVDMRESFLCGYLRIKGLTEDHPSLTTYFEGEIIGSKYTFITQHPEWGSNEKVDRQHWARFQAYKSKFSSRPELGTKDWNQKEHLFMRWKEYFLVPDHRVRTINGASFEGFYYISFNQVLGSIEGIYFHAKSEKSVPHHHG